MLPDIEELKRTYSAFSDQKLIKFTTEQASDLRPEAVEVLKAEIEKRGLGLNLQGSIERQVREVNESEMEEYYGLIRSLPCPQCHSTGDQLNATMTGEVVSVVFFTSYVKRAKIACPTCLDKANTNAMIKSATLGWWALPWGAVKTVQSLFFNYQMKKYNGLAGPSATLESIVRANIGKIEAFRHDETQLQNLIRNM